MLWLIPLRMRIKEHKSNLGVRPIFCATDPPARWTKVSHPTASSCTSMSLLPTLRMRGCRRGQDRLEHYLRNCSVRVLGIVRASFCGPHWSQWRVFRQSVRLAFSKPAGCVSFRPQQSSICSSTRFGRDRFSTPTFRLAFVSFVNFVRVYPSRPIVPATESPENDPDLPCPTDPAF